MLHYPVRQVIIMQLSRAAELREDWAKKGNPPCDHPSIEKEYYQGAQTGDYVCTTCGETRWGRDGFRRDKAGE